MFLYSRVAESVQRVQGGVETHVVQTHAKPFIEFMALNDFEASISVGDLEDGAITVTPVLSVDFDKPENGPDRTEKRVGGASEWDHVYSLSELVVLRLWDRENNSVVDIVAEWFHVLPAQDHLEVDLLGGLSNQIATSQHGQEVEETQVTINLDSLL